MLLNFIAAVSVSLYDEVFCLILKNKHFYSILVAGMQHSLQPQNTVC